MSRDAKGHWLKGSSGNPAGRSTRIREYRFYDILLSTITDQDWRDIVTKAVDQAKKGDQAARKWLADYAIGTPPQQHILTGADNEPIEIEVVFKK